MKQLLPRIITAAKEAGAAILEVYATDFTVHIKDDSSPLTLADRRSHEILEQAISALTPGIPVCSEEGLSVPYEDRRKWMDFYLVDPLDGTKEFVKRNGEFTVNVALIRGGIPVLGVIFVPVTGSLYFAAEGQGAWRQAGDEEPTRISVRTEPDPDGLVIAASRSHGTQALDNFLGALRVKETISAGSALKFCLVAEGKADIYPRFGPTWEWDTAAGHAILREAGGKVTLTDGSAELGYNKPSLKHEGFIAQPAKTSYRL